MNKPILIFLVMVLMAAGLLFSDQLLAAFQGMTVLEAMKQIVGFLLHVAWVTILGFVLMTINKLGKPWIRMLLQKQRKGARRQVGAGRIRNLVQGRKIQLPRGNKDQLLLWLIQQMSRNPPARPSRPQEDMDEDGNGRIKLDF